MPGNTVAGEQSLPLREEVVEVQNWNFRNVGRRFNAQEKFRNFQLQETAWFWLLPLSNLLNHLTAHFLPFPLKSSKMAKDWSFGEVLKAVFPLLNGPDLASCMCVCRLWRDIARDDYFWKCLCAKRWPSICKRPTPPPFSYHKIFLTFSKRQRRRTLLPPRLSFDDLEFYIDLWSEEKLIFSEVVPGPVLRKGIKSPPPGICDVLRTHLEGPGYKMAMPVNPKFSMPLHQTINVSVLVGRRDTDKMACIVNKSWFDYVDGTAYRALAFDYLDFSPVYPFISGIRAWVSLLFMEGGGSDGLIDVFGIEMDFCDAANSEEEVMWLLDMLDWK